MLHLKMPHGTVTNNISVMRKIATVFCADLFSSDTYDLWSVAEVQEELPQLDEARAASLASPITLDKMTTDVNNQSLPLYQMNQ